MLLGIRQDMTERSRFTEPYDDSARTMLFQVLLTSEVQPRYKAVACVVEANGLNEDKQDLYSERKRDKENVRLTSHQDQRRHSIIILSPRPFTFMLGNPCSAAPDPAVTSKMKRVMTIGEEYVASGEPGLG